MIFSLENLKKRDSIEGDQPRLRFSMLVSVLSEARKFFYDIKKQ
jgi:hypothetical protein